MASADLIEKAPLERYVPPARPSLVGLSRAGLLDALAGIGVPEGKRKMRAQQIWSWLYVRGVTGFEQMTSLSKELRAVLEEHFTLARPDVVAEQVSVDGTRKWLLRLPGERGAKRPKDSRLRSNASTSRTPTAARSACRARSAAPSTARSVTPEPSAWCAT